MICLKRKQYLLGAESWNDFYFSAELTFQESVSKQNFYACARAKIKAMSSRYFAYIPASVKSPLKVKSVVI